MIRRILCLCAVALLAVPALGLAKQGEWPETVKLGVIPTEGASETAERFKPLTSHLEKVLGVEVELFTASDYAGIITAMANNHIDFAYFGPKSYTEASEKADAQAVALETGMDGQPGYTGVIITRSDSGIETMDQAKGKSFAFTDPNSTSGFLVPNVLFARDMKVKPEDYFQEVKFSGSHGASILAVKNGSIQVAATNNVDLNRMQEKGAASWDDFNIIWTSELIPGSPMTARSDLPESLKAAYAGALFMFNSDEEGLKKLQIGGYIPADDSTYDIIRYLKRLKKELAAK